MCGAEAEGLAGAEQGLLGLPEGAGVGAPPRCVGAELWAQHIWEFGSSHTPVTLESLYPTPLCPETLLLSTILPILALKFVCSGLSVNTFITPHNSFKAVTQGYRSHQELVFLGHFQSFAECTNPLFFCIAVCNLTVDFQSDSDSFNPTLWEEQRQQRMTVAFEFEDKKEEEENAGKVKVSSV